MRDLRGRTSDSAVQRFIFGAGIGIAISVPLFLGIEDLPIKILFMVAFAGIMGTGQVIADGRSERSQRALRWMLVIGIATLVAGIAAFFVFN